jgi:hypothetical protein
VVTATKPRSLLYDARFRSYWLGQTVSQLGDRVTELALPLIAVTMLAATPSQVGLLTAAVWLPALVSLVVGSWSTISSASGGSWSSPTWPGHWCSSRSRWRTHSTP